MAVSEADHWAFKISKEFFLNKLECFFHDNIIIIGGGGRGKRERERGGSLCGFGRWASETTSNSEKEKEIERVSAA